MPPFGYGLYVWLKNNPIAQGIVVAGVLYVAFKAYIALRVRSATGKFKLKQEREVLKQRQRAKDYIDTMEEELEDEAHDAIEARDRAGPLDPDSMSDEQHARIFGRDGTSS